MNMPSFARKTYKRERYGRTDPNYGGRKRRRMLGMAPGALAALRRRGRSLGLRNLRTGGLLGIEKKFFDTSVAAGALASPADATGGEFDPATILCLNGVPQGDTASTRDGYEIALLSLEIEGVIRVAPQVDQTAADAASMIYIAVVLDKQTNGAQLNSEDVFTNPAASSVTASNPLRNMSYTTRFQVMAKKAFKTVQPTMSWDGTNVEQGGYMVPFRFFVNLKGLKTRFQAGTTTGYVGTIVDNSLHLIAYCNQTSTAPLIYYNSRLRFVG